MNDIDFNEGERRVALLEAANDIFATLMSHVKIQDEKISDLQRQLSEVPGIARDIDAFRDRLSLLEKKLGRTEMAMLRYGRVESK